MRATRSAALLLVLAGCPKASTVALSSLPSLDQDNPRLAVEGTATLTTTPGAGTALHADITIAPDARSSVRVDLSRVGLQVDGYPWEDCKPGVIDYEQQVRLVGAGERLFQPIDCHDLPKPHDHIVVRLFITGAGTKGTVDLTFTEPQAAG